MIFSATSRAQDLYVGSNSANVTTNFTSGTNLFGITFIGFLEGATNNLLNVSGSSTLLSNSSTLFLGLYGGGNSLVISDGARVANAAGTIGYTASSSGNSALVTGTNSLWTNSSSVSVGYSGSGNSLVIADAGTVSSTGGVIGITWNSSNNSVLVTGTNSLWTNDASRFKEQAQVYVGYDGCGNTLAISNGGRVATAGNGGMSAYTAVATAWSSPTVERLPSASVATCATMDLRWSRAPIRSGPTAAICTSAQAVAAVAWSSPTAVSWRTRMAT
jgi:T5SS/PEP-CTERM-associated repeat protein